jgi:RNA polymerase sigma-70 factor (ECF subfamily)
MPDLRGEAPADIATEAADDALMAVLRRLDDFRGESRFTTWAWKFAILQAAARMRGRAWQGRELPLPPEGWERLAAAASDPAGDAETAELLGAVAVVVREDLTARQREVLVALAIDGVPIDVLAERRGTTRGALYKTLHDARRRLRAGLAARGQTVPGGAP